MYNNYSIVVHAYIICFNLRSTVHNNCIIFFPSLSPSLSLPPHLSLPLPTLAAYTCNCQLVLIKARVSGATVILWVGMGGTSAIPMAHTLGVGEIKRESLVCACGRVLSVLRPCSLHETNTTITDTTGAHPLVYR